MANSTESIDHITLEKLVEAGVVHAVEVFGVPGGWCVVAQYGMTKRTLAPRRGSARVFRKFNTLVSYLKALGITKYHVDASKFDPDAIGATLKRKDTSERLKKLHQAAALVELDSNK